MKPLLLPTLIMAALAAAAPQPGGPRLPPATPAARCTALIAQFDAVIVSRFDYRILMLEDYELAEARSWRADAEAACAAGRHELGLALIASALEQIGVAPEDDQALPPD